MNSLVLVDGSYYLYRAFHALPPLSTKDGRPVGAIHGVLSMLNKLASEFPSEKFVVVFDAKGPTFRSSLYPDYKKNRPEMPADLSVQIEPLQQIIRSLGFPLLCIQGVEADDIIGTLAKFEEKEGHDVIISTGDKDLAQLVSTKISLINTMTRKLTDPLEVKKQYGVDPSQIPDWLALTGDTVDNIPGIPKCGPKTASKWLNDYGSLSGIINCSNSIPGKVGESLRANLAQLPLSLKLTTIRCDVDLPADLFSLKREEPDLASLKKLYTEFEMASFLRDLDTSDLFENKVYQKNYEVILSVADLENWISQCMKKKNICFRYRNDQH